MKEGLGQKDGPALSRSCAVFLRKSGSKNPAHMYTLVLCRAWGQLVRLSQTLCHSRPRVIYYPGRRNVKEEPSALKNTFTLLRASLM